MTKFLYIADSHVGASPNGYQQQKGYGEALPRILSTLCEYILAAGDIDFVLHGGDMIDSTTDESILAAAALFNLPVPVYLCLGNHDLIAKEHDNLRCVLGAHNHMNMRINHEGTEFVTVSALIETPFDFKLFEVTPQSMKMSTISLTQASGLDCDYNTDKAFVQGRPVDRSFRNECTSTPAL